MVVENDAEKLLSKLNKESWRLNSQLWLALLVRIWPRIGYFYLAHYSMMHCATTEGLPVFHPIIASRNHPDIMDRA